MSRTYLSALLLCPSAADVYAWNSSGHQVVDLIAWSQLDEDDQAAAVSLLKDHP